MKAVLLIIPVVTLLVGCNATSNQTKSDSSTRAAITKDLIAQNRLADALQQSRILTLQYPHNPTFAEQALQIEKRIAQEKYALLSTLSSRSNGTQTRIILLKALALDPNDTELKARLRKLTMQRELASATKKTTMIAKVFRKSSKEAESEIKLKRILLQIDEATALKNYSSLLNLAKELHGVAPSHPAIRSAQYIAYERVGSQLQKDGSYKQSIEYFEKAIKFASKSDKMILKRQIADIKRSRSNHYFLAAQKVFKQDIEQAIDYLQKSLSFDKRNAKAKQQLNRAEKIQGNLKRIRNR